MNKKILDLIVKVKNWGYEAGLKPEQRISLLALLTGELDKLHQEAEVEERILQQLYLKRALGGAVNNSQKPTA